MFRAHLQAVIISRSPAPNLWLSLRKDRLEDAKEEEEVVCTWTMNKRGDAAPESNLSPLLHNEFLVATIISPRRRRLLISKEMRAKER